VQFGARNGGSGSEEGLLACHLVFDRGRLTVVQGPAENPDIALTSPPSRR
jgi:hypothetical protein